MLVEKSTGYALDAEVLARADWYFQNPRFIHLLRHPGGTVRSAEEVRLDRLLLRGSHPFAPRELGELVWLVCQQNILGFLESVPEGRQHRVRFEELVADPRQSLEELCGFLNVPFEPAMLRPYEDAHVKMSKGLYLPSRVPGDPKFWSHRAIDVRAADAWRAELAEDSLSDLTWELAGKLGYERSTREEVRAGRSDPLERAPLGSAADTSSLQRAFEAQVQRTPDAVAAEFQGRSMTYRELNRCANQLAHRLKRLGVVPNIPVAVAVERSLSFLVGLVAVLKAGGVYVPLDPTEPAGRLRLVLEDSGARVLVTNRALEETFKHPATIVHLEGDASLIAKESGGNPTSAVVGSDRAYIVHTSGSTGRPKGVAVTHMAATTHFLKMRETFGLKTNDRVLLFAASGFDVSFEQVFTTLFARATVVVRGDVLWNANELPGAFSRLGVTVANLPASYWHQLCEGKLHEGARVPEDLRLLILGGDRLRCEPVMEWQRSRWRRVKLMNAYGPTETVVTATVFEIPQRFADGPRPARSTWAASSWPRGTLISLR